MNAGLTTWLADAILIAGLALATLAVVGVARMPDAYMKLHAAGKATSLAIAAIVLATAFGGDAAVFLPALLAAGFLLVTAPVAAHAIGRAAAAREEPMRGPDAIDESGRGLGESGGSR